MVKKQSNSAKSATEQELTFMDDPMIRGSSKPYVGPPETGNVFNGYPFIGPVSDIKADDPEYRQPQAAVVVYTKQFLTTDAKQLEEYNNIRQAAAMGKAHIYFEEKIYNIELKGWHILISWADKVYLAPKKRKE